MASSAGLRRQRARQQILQHDPHSVTTTTTGTNHLVICGVVDDVRDAWLFGDFLGFTSALKEHSVHGTFINCYNLNVYFTNTTYNDIKFGRRWEIPDTESWTSGDEIPIYRRWDFEHRTRWWEQLGRHEVGQIIHKIQEWVDSRSQTTKPGGIVSIILIGHGTPEGIVLGRSILAPATLASICSSFGADVQLNLIVKSCYSGAFARAFEASRQNSVYVHTSAQSDEKSYSEPRSISGRQRNSYFGSAFVRTLGFANDPEEVWTLGKQQKFLKDHLNKPTIPEQLRSNPQMASDSKATTLMKDILTRDYVDVSFFNAPVRARRIIAPPSVVNRPPSATHIHHSVDYEAACSFIGQEVNMTYTTMPDPDDMALTENWYIKWATPQLKAAAMQETFYGLAFRFLIQERLLMVAEDLISRGFVSITSLYTPMRLSGSFPYSRSVKIILDVLKCFTLGQDCLDHVLDFPGRPFDSAAKWLAVLVARSCTNWPDTIIRWIAFHFLGVPRLEPFEAILRRNFAIQTNPNEAVDTTEFPLPQCGFWLPHGMKVREFVGPWIQRYNEMRRLYQSIANEPWPGDPAIECAVDDLLAVETVVEAGQPPPDSYFSGQPRYE